MVRITPVRKLRISEEIVDQIRELVLSGELRPGDQLPPERELADRFQVSRASIREALTALQVMGLLERTRGGSLTARGNSVWFTVAPISSFLATRKHLVVEPIEVRRMIEPEAARLAAERADEYDLARIDECLQRMEQDIAAGGLGVEHDAAFHSAIAQATKNELLVRIIDVIGDAVRQHRKALQTREGARRSLAQHRAILEAIKAHDGDRAYHEAMRHVDYVRELIQARLGVDDGGVAPGE
jgi:GntR family transcriptional repressor for pyruvate dehydrogenase complex